MTRQFERVRVPFGVLQEKGAYAGSIPAGNAAED